MNASIKALIWTYALLILIEGALRKWVLPGQADMLLIVRDPVLIAIYVLSMAKGTFPLNGWGVAAICLAAVSLVTSIIGGCTNPLILAYGLRINYLHLPLIWIIATHFERKDVERLGSVFLICAIPITLLMVEQFRSSPFDWVNKGIGMDEGGQIFGAEGRIRPPGVFAFITGPQIYFPICAAFLLSQLSHGRRLWLPLLIAAGCSILVALPISISRTVMLATGIVGATYVVILPRVSGSAGNFIKPLLIAGVAGAICTQLPIFDEAMRVFGVRWTQAASSVDGDGWQDVLARSLQTFTNPFHYAAEAPIFGHGIGMGSNVASRVLHGKVGFMLAEEEFAKIFLELGFAVGAAFILYRVALVLHLLVLSWRVLREQRYCLPLLLLSAVASVILFGQWAPPTILGFSVLGAGLILACAKPPPETAADTEAPAAAPETAPRPQHSAYRLAATPKQARKPGPGEERSP